MTSKKVIMPAELTAENGAKYLMIGEFSETVFIPCNECDDGVVHSDSDAVYADECDVCSGSGGYDLKVAITWPTIKAIHARAVKHLSQPIEDES